MKKLLFVIVVFFLGLSNLAICQDSDIGPIRFELERVYPAIWVTQHTLDTAQNLVDLNPHFKTAWVRKYLNVETVTKHNGRLRRARSEDDHLTLQQINDIKQSDPGSTVEVKVQYIPENHLKNNEPKDWDFSFVVEPQQSAEFPGGRDQMIKFLKNEVIDQLNMEQYHGFDLNTIKFTVDEEGHIIDAHVFWPSTHEDIDSFLLASIFKMPVWKPAEYHNGLKVKQEFFFAVGNMENCVMNLLDIKKMLK